MSHKIFYIVFIGLLALSTYALAATITTSVRFIIPSDTSFSVSVPASNSTFSSSTSAGIYFNSSSTTITMINASISDAGTASQTNTTAIFRYRNDGNVPINITISFNAITSTCINVKASVGSTGWQSTCTNFTVPPTNLSCTNWNSSSLTAKNVTNGLAVNQVRDLWLWADYTSCSVGLDETDTITHTSGK